METTQRIKQNIPIVRLASNALFTGNKIDIQIRMAMLEKQIADLKTEMFRKPIDLENYLYLKKIIQRGLTMKRSELLYGTDPSIERSEHLEHCTYPSNECVCEYEAADEYMSRGIEGKDGF